MPLAEKKLIRRAGTSSGELFLQAKTFCVRVEGAEMTVAEKIEALRQKNGK